MTKVITEYMINIILWLLFGGLAGWIASMMMGYDAGLGITGNIIVGVLGAFIGGWIADNIGIGGRPGTERPTGVWSFVVAVLGAVLLLGIVNLIVY